MNTLERLQKMRAAARNANDVWTSGQVIPLLDALIKCRTVLDKFAKHVPSEESGSIERAVCEAFAIESRATTAVVDGLLEDL